MSRSLSVAMLALALGAAAPAAGALTLQPCRLQGVEREARCGQIVVPEDRSAPSGRSISVHFALVPALAKNKAPDPVYVLAGGPGQAASRIAGATQRVLAQVNARRDIVYVDQRGTGGSNALSCRSPDERTPLRELIDPQQLLARLRECVRGLDADPRQYATWIAMQDLDDVRAALGHERINLWGGSYGTRAALEYLRQFPQRVRSAVLDGAAPADMVLPVSFALDAQTALERLLAACTQEPACSRRHPSLAADLDRLFAAAAGGIEITVTHPFTGQREPLRLDRAALAGLLRAPLYAPPLAAVLPTALASASQGDFAALLALSTALSGPTSEDFAEVMHFAVVCAEDMPRVDELGIAAARRTRFGIEFIGLYRSACRLLPHALVPAAFYDPPQSDAPVLILSGGADPATPPRHGEAVASRLKNTRHLIAPSLGHGVSAQGCAADLITRFVRQASFDGIDGTCLQRLPAPVFLQMPDGR